MYRIYQFRQIFRHMCVSRTYGTYRLALKLYQTDQNTISSQPCEIFRTPALLCTFLDLSLRDPTIILTQIIIQLF